jgi:hypothetical protein
MSAGLGGNVAVFTGVDNSGLLTNNLKQAVGFENDQSSNFFGNVNVSGNLTVTGITTTVTINKEIINTVEIVKGNLVAASSQPSTSTTTGALVVTGGAGIGGRLNIGGNTIISSGTDMTGTTSGALILANGGGLNVSGNVYVGLNLYVGASALTTALTAPTIVAVDNGATYAQIAMKNSSSSGSADFLAYPDNGTDTDGFVDMGITGSAYSDPNFTITKSNDGYIFIQPFNSIFYSFFYSGQIITQCSLHLFVSNHC